MRTIVHISDIHFGKVHRETLAPLVRSVHELRPNLVVVSGDLTQLALQREFKEARAFLLALPGPQIVVPGNHDVPILSPLERLLSPLRRFRRYITRDMYPFYEDEELAVLGMNTARKTMTKYGHVSQRQLNVIREKLRDVPDEKTKVIVTHHPFDVPKGYHNSRQIIRRSNRAMKVFAELGADLFLAGHLHTGFISDTIERYRFANHSALIVQAGTASSRGHSEPNSFNLIECHGERIGILRYEWNAELQAFHRANEGRFVHSGSGWTPDSASEDAPEHGSGELHDKDAK